MFAFPLSGITSPSLIPQPPYAHTHTHPTWLSPSLLLGFCSDFSLLERLLSIILYKIIFLFHNFIFVFICLYCSYHYLMLCINYYYFIYCFPLIEDKIHGTGTLLCTLLNLQCLHLRTTFYLNNKLLASRYGYQDSKSLIYWPKNSWLVIGGLGLKLRSS